MPLILLGRPRPGHPLPVKVDESNPQASSSTGRPEFAVRDRRPCRSCRHRTSVRARSRPRWPRAARSATAPSRRPSRVPRTRSAPGDRQAASAIASRPRSTELGAYTGETVARSSAAAHDGVDPARRPVSPIGQLQPSAAMVPITAADRGRRRGASRGNAARSSGRCSRRLAVEVGPVGRHQSSSEYARSVRNSAKSSSRTSRSSRPAASASRPSPAPPSRASSSSRIAA